MTEQQYETILSALADKIKTQEETITLQKWQIEALEKRISEAENPPRGEQPKALEIR